MAYFFGNQSPTLVSFVCIVIITKQDWPYWRGALVDPPIFLSFDGPPAKYA